MYPIIGHSEIIGQFKERNRIWQGNSCHWWRLWSCGTDDGPGTWPGWSQVDWWWAIWSRKVSELYFQCSSSGREEEKICLCSALSRGSRDGLSSGYRSNRSLLQVNFLNNLQFTWDKLCTSWQARGTRWQLFVWPVSNPGSGTRRHGPRQCGHGLVWWTGLARPGTESQGFWIFEGEVCLGRELWL